MNSRKIVFLETGLVALGQLLCCGAMVGIFALLGHYDRSVLLGAIVGLGVAVGNFFFMAVAVSLAADKAAAQNVKGGQALIRISYFVRLLVMAVVLYAFVKSGLCNVIAAVLPLVFTRPILTMGEFFRKSGESKA